MNLELNHLFDRLEQLGAAVFSKDLNGRYLSMNEAGCALLNTPLNQIVGKTDESIFESASARLMMERDQDLISKDKTKTYSSLAQRNGEWKLYRSAKMILRSSQNLPAGLIGVSFALNAEHSKAEAELVNRVFEQMQLKAYEFQKAYLQRRLLTTQLVGKAL